jgi:preprotein translocase subunit SecY
MVLVVFRFGSYIAAPGVNPSEVARLLSSESNLFGLFNTFSGGALSRLSLFTMGVMPYITASIVVQLLSTFYPPMEQLKKEGERGRQKMNYYTRLATVGLAIFQSITMMRFLSSSGVLMSETFAASALVVLTFVTGTMTLMWLGEQITQKGLGQGVSLIIFTGIVTGLPRVLGQSLENMRYGTLSPVTFFVSLLVLFCALFFVVYVERAQRKIPVHYVRRQPGYQRQQQAQQRGVMPCIFASNIILAPATIAQLFHVPANHWFMQFVQENLSSGKPLFMVLFGTAIMFFSFIYTAVIFNPQDMAENLKKAGGVIQGIRPGVSTAQYINVIMSRLTVLGALYITAVAILPEVLNYVGTIPFTFGGTSLLIVAVVVMDFFTQVQTQLFSAQYESVLKRYQPKKVLAGPSVGTM